MNNVGIKIISNDEMPKCIKILRKYCSYSIGEIKERIEDKKYIIEGSYVNEEDILLIVKLHNELCDNGIKVELYEHDRKTTVDFLNNLIEMYYNIDVGIRDRIDEENE